MQLAIKRDKSKNKWDFFIWKNHLTIHLMFCIYEHKQLVSKTEFKAKRRNVDF